MANGGLNFDLNAVVDTVAERVAAKVCARLAQDRPSTVRPRLLTVEQAGAYLGRTKAAVQHLVAERRLPIVRDGGRVFLDRVALDTWIESHTEPAEEGT
jgi:excisionase family DNA binding protein